MNGRRALLYVAGFAGLAAVSRGRRRPRRRPVDRAAAAGDGGARDARRRARARAPARLAARPPPAAARRLPAGMRAQVPLPPQASGARRTSPSTRTSCSAGGDRLRPRRLPARRRRRRPACACCCRWSSTSTVGRGGLPRPEPAPAAAGHRHPPRPRRASASPPTRRRAIPGPRIAFVLLRRLACSPCRARSGSERRHATDALAGGVTAVLAAVLALSIIGTTSVEAGRPLQRLAHVGHRWAPARATFRFDLHAELPATPRPRRRRAWSCACARPSPSYWRASVLADFTGDELARRRRRTAASCEPGARRRLGLRGAAGPVPRRREGCVTQRFEIESTYTDRLFVGGWPVEVRSALPLDLQMTSAAAVAVTPPRGPSLDYTRHRGGPGPGADGPHRARALLPGGRDAALPALPFPRGTGRPAAPASEAAWRAEAAAVPAGREWVGLYALNERIVGERDGPVPRGARRGAVPAHQLRLLAAAAGRGLRLAVRGVPLRDAHRVLPALRRRDGRAPALQRHPRAGGRSASPPARRSGTASGWSRATTPTPGWRRTSPASGGRSSTRRPGREIPSTSDGARERPRCRGRGRAGRRRRVAGAGGGPAADGRARVADPSGQPARPSSPTETGGRAPWLVLALLAAVLSSGRRAARCCAGAACAAAPGRTGSARPSRSCTPTSVTTAPRRRRRRPSTRRRATCSDHLGVDAGDLPDRVQAVVFGGRRASDADLEDLAALRRRVRRRLRERSGRLAALLALYGVRPRRRRESRLPVARRARPATRS